MGSSSLHVREKKGSLVLQQDLDASFLSPRCQGSALSVKANASDWAPGAL